MIAFLNICFEWVGMTDPVKLWFANLLFAGYTESVRIPADTDAVPVFCSQGFLCGARFQKKAIDVLEALIEATYTKRRSGSFRVGTSGLRHFGLFSGPAAT